MARLFAPAALQSHEPLTVTKPLLPTFEAIAPYLRDILDRGWVTNGGKYVQRLERELARYLDTNHALAVASGTCGLDLAVRALVPEGEVITTAYSFPATYHVLINNTKVTPVFADIDPHYGLDPEAVRRRITPRTRAILAVHTYGYPCQHDELQRIAREHDLKLIYDAAHTFGMRVGGRGIASLGDASVFSLHATKVFNTLEGGCVATRHPEYANQIHLLRNFGIRNEEAIEAFGVNGKMDEVRAAFGLASLPLVSRALSTRKAVVERYLQFFSSIAVDEIRICGKVYERDDITLNYSYFPIEIAPNSLFDRESVFGDLRAENIVARRYFYPSLVSVPLYDGLYDPSQLPQTRASSERVLCLPVHQAMTEGDVHRVVNAIRRALKVG